MRIMPINDVYANKQTSFNGYQESLHEAIGAKFNYSSEVNYAIRELYNELLTTSGTRRTPLFDLFNRWMSFSPVEFIKELCKPIDQLKPEFRDIVLDSSKQAVSVLDGEGRKGIYIKNNGKQGFFNYLFNNQNAKNDVNLVLYSDFNDLILGTKKDKYVIFEQKRENSWNVNYYDFSSGQKIKERFGHGYEDDGSVIDLVY